MLDILNFPLPEKADIQVFYANGNTWQNWLKPRGKSHAYMLCMGGGGGGGGGTSSAAGAGGTGGGSSTLSTLYVPLTMIPDQLFVRVGTGGAGGAGVLNAAGGQGQYGMASMIAINPDFSGVISAMTRVTTTLTVTPNPSDSRIAVSGQGIYIEGADQTEYNGFKVLSAAPTTTFTVTVLNVQTTPATGALIQYKLVSDVLLASNGGSGGSGGSTGVGTAGTSVAANVLAHCPLAGIGIFKSVAGQAGGTGNDVNNTGAALTYPTTGLIMTGGTGGGAPTGGTGTATALTAAGIFPGIPAGLATTPGRPGYALYPKDYPFFFHGGGGGAGGAVSYVGGNGSYGSGGGGAGGVPAAVTSAAGGRGGDGLVIIISW